MSRRWSFPQTPPGGRGCHRRDTCRFAKRQVSRRHAGRSGKRALPHVSERPVEVGRIEPPRAAAGERRVLAGPGNVKVHAADVDVAAADRDGRGIRRGLRKAGRQDQAHRVTPRRADAGCVFRIGRRAAELVEGVVAQAVRHGRGEHVAAGR